MSFACALIYADRSPSTVDMVAESLIASAQLPQHDEKEGGAHSAQLATRLRTRRYDGIALSRRMATLSTSCAPRSDTPDHVDGVW
jgi:hypothetical protein